MAVEVFFTEFDLDRRVIEDRHSALATVGVTRQLESDWEMLDDGIEVIGFMDQCDHGFVSGDGLEHRSGVGVTEPDEVGSSEGDGMLSDGDSVILIDEQLDFGLGEGLLEIGARHIPAIMVAEDGEDAEFGLELIEVLEDLREVGRVVVDEIASQGNQVGRICVRVVDDFTDDVGIEAGVEMEVGEMRDGQAVESHGE